MKKWDAKQKLNKNDPKNHVEDLEKVPKYQLLEMLDRQKNLLKNRATLNKLPDRGEKIKQIKNQIEEELEKRNDLEKKADICNVLAGLSLTSTQVNALEWTKNVEGIKKETCDQVENYEDNPLKILATHNGTIFSKKSTRVEEISEPLITKEDIEEIYAMKLCERIDKVLPKNKFLPHKTLNHEFPTKKSPAQYKPQDLCAASQPPTKYGNIKTISLESSLRIQYEQAQYMKALQIKHAAERLKDKSYSIGQVLPSHEKMNIYRNPHNITSDSEDDDEEEILEVEDDCAGDDDKEGTVTFHLTD